jgi:hypothetical protein
MGWGFRERRDSPFPGLKKLSLIPSASAIAWDLCGEKIHCVLHDSQWNIFYYYHYHYFIITIIGGITIIGVITITIFNSRSYTC